MKLTPEIYFREVPRVLDMDIRTELYTTNEFTLAVAVILSAQTTDKQVNTVTPTLFAIADTPEKMLVLGENGLKNHIKTISFFNNKAKNIIGLSVQLAQTNYSPPEGESTAPSCGSVGGNSDWKFSPEYHNRDALMKLPGIGQKTANVIMNVCWGEPLLGVDTHVFRNAHRYGWVDKSDNTPEKVEAKLMKFIPKKYHAMANHVMVLHGRYICQARHPKCGECPVAKWCESKDKII